jgi:hypothetical protein
MEAWTARVPWHCDGEIVGASDMLHDAIAVRIPTVNTVGEMRLPDRRSHEIRDGRGFGRLLIWCVDDAEKMVRDL